MSGRQGKTQTYYAELLIAALEEAGGRIENPSGFAQSTLVRAAGLTTGQSSAVIAHLVERDVMRRERRGKRVYWIALVPEEHRRPPEGEPPRPDPVVAPTPPAEAKPVVVSADNPTANEIAAALLARVLEVIDRKEQTAIDSDRLAATLEENGRLRVQLRSAEANAERDRKQIEALGNERNGLRRRVQTLESNLTAATKDVKHVVDEQVQQRLAAFMQERPQLRAVKGDEPK